MPRIDRTSHLAALIRAQLGQSQNMATMKLAQQRLAAQSVEVAKRERKSYEAAPSRTFSPAGDSKSIEQFIIQRVRSLSPEDPQRRRKAFRLFMESVLLQEFGMGLVEDAGFQKLIDQVLQQMDSDSGLCITIQEAADALLAQSGNDAPSTSSDT